MTSPDAKKLWRRAIKSTSIVNVFIAEKIMNYTNLHSIMSNLVAEVEKILQRMSLPVARNVTKTKVVVIGSDGVERHLDADLLENR